jgi:hypothetical protein
MVGRGSVELPEFFLMPKRQDWHGQIPVAAKNRVFVLKSVRAAGIGFAYFSGKVRFNQLFKTGVNKIQQIRGKA